MHDGQSIVLYVYARSSPRGVPASEREKERDSRARPRTNVVKFNRATNEISSLLLREEDPRPPRELALFVSHEIIEFANLNIRPTPHLRWIATADSSTVLRKRASMFHFSDPLISLMEKNHVLFKIAFCKKFQSSRNNKNRKIQATGIKAGIYSDDGEWTKLKSDSFLFAST